MLARLWKEGYEEDVWQDVSKLRQKEMKPLVKNFRKFLNDLINYKEDDYYYEDY